MSIDFSIWVNSGTVDSITYQKSDNINAIEITNSDQSYYQNGFVQLFDTDEKFNIGDSIQIQINTTLQFDGYIARRQQSIVSGRLSYSYQLVGRTYDLWRYVTDEDTIFMSGSTTYIASSLCKSYCNISGSYIEYDSGFPITNEIDFSNTVIGEALVTLSKLDGCRFYVESNGNLRYYKPTTRDSDFTITEADILEMSPVEEADEDIVNDCLVIGGTGYSSKTIQDVHTNTAIFPSSCLVAQQFTAEDNQLAALQVYLDKTTGDKAPTILEFEIWGSSDQQLWEDTFTDSVRLDRATDPNWEVVINNGYLEVSGVSNQVSRYLGEGAGGNYYDKYVGFIFKAHSSGVLTECQYFSQSRLIYQTDGEYCWLYLYSANTTTLKPVGDPLISGSVWLAGYNYPAASRPIVFQTDKQYPIASGHSYSLVFTRTNLVESNKMYINLAYSPSLDATDYARYIHSTDGITWYSEAGYYPRGQQSSGSIALFLKTYIPTKASIYSTKVSTDTQYMKVTLSGCANPVGLDGIEIPNRYLLSGSNSGSVYATGDKLKGLTTDVWSDVFPFECPSGICVKFILSSNGYTTPKIGYAKLEIADSLGVGSGVPASGTKVEFSDEIYFDTGDIPYPPSYSAWQPYTSPKLQLTEGNTYWMVFHHYSGGTTQDGKYWSYCYDPLNDTVGKLAYSWRNNGSPTKGFGTHWSTNSTDPTDVPPGSLTFNLGWREGDISYRATDEESIATYGRHFKKITNSNITTSEAVQALAENEIANAMAIPKKGSLVINGRTDIQTYYRFTPDLDNFDINEVLDIVSFTQRINNKGFTTIINYGVQPYDITREIEVLKESG